MPLCLRPHEGTAVGVRLITCLAKRRVPLAGIHRFPTLIVIKFLKYHGFNNLSGFQSKLLELIYLKIRPVSTVPSAFLSKC